MAFGSAWGGESRALHPPCEVSYWAAARALQSPTHCNWQTCAFTQTHSSFLSVSETLKEQGSGKRCSTLKGIRKICKCSSWLLHVRTVAAAWGLQKVCFFSLSISKWWKIFCFSPFPLLFYFILFIEAFLSHPAEANVQYRNMVSKPSWQYHSSGSVELHLLSLEDHFLCGFMIALRSLFCCKVAALWERESVSFWL